VPGVGMLGRKLKPFFHFGKRFALVLLSGINRTRNFNKTRLEGFGWPVKRCLSNTAKENRLCQLI
jgi:hypothetical protein